MTPEEKISILEAQLKEALSAFEEYFYATDDYNNSYSSDRMQEAEERLWTLKRKVAAENKSTEKTERPAFLAKEVPLGSRHYFNNEEVEIIGYSKQGDQVVVVENKEGKVWCENVNDVIFYSKDEK